MDTSDHKAPVLHHPSHAGTPDCIHGWFERQAHRTPDRTAVECEGASLTYAALDARADLLAARLRDAGVGPDVLVALCLERSLDAVVAILAVLKAGGAYVPLDPEYPTARLALMLEDATPKVIVAHSMVRERLPAHNADEILIDTIDWSAPRSAALPPADVSPDNLAYCIFTSGSTGRPKGVVATHASVVNLVEWQSSAYRTRPDAT